MPASTAAMCCTLRQAVNMWVKTTAVSPSDGYKVLQDETNDAVQASETRRCDKHSKREASRWCSRTDAAAGPPPQTRCA
jgi:hypothetical protein